MTLILVLIKKTIIEGEEVSTHACTKHHYHYSQTKYFKRLISYVCITSDLVKAFTLFQFILSKAMSNNSQKINK